MENYLIPANSKKSQLILSVFRPVDLFILLIGGFITLILMFAISGDTMSQLFIKLLPLCFSLLLVVPIPYYHNVLVFLQEFYLYCIKQKVYSWKGWCASDEYGEKSDKK